MKEVSEFIKVAESNFIACLYKKPVLFADYDKTIDGSLIVSEEWKFFYELAEQMWGKGYKTFDEISVTAFVSKNKKLLKKYEANNQFDIVHEAMSYSELVNFEAYLGSLQKFAILNDLDKLGFDIKPVLADIKDLTIGQIERYYELQINKIFGRFIADEVFEYDMIDDLDELIEEADSGEGHGLPFLKYPLLDDTIGGAVKGMLYLLAGLSGTGKTTMTASIYLSTILEMKEKCVVLINEEDEKKWKTNMITWVANNIFDTRFNKKRFRDGHFTNAERQILKTSTNWLKKNLNNGQIILIPLDYYTVDLAIRKIKEHAKKGVEHFILDTFKSSYDISSNLQVWLSMMQDMRALYDVIKPANLNVTLWATSQLGKSSGRLRYLTQDNLGMSKNIIDVASVALLTRLLYEDEIEDCKAYRLIGTNSKEEIALDHNKNYIVIFIEKNRNGWAKERQLLMEVDLGRNVYKEVGFIDIFRDF